MLSLDVLVGERGKLTSWPAGVYAGDLILDTAGQGAVVNVSHDVVVLAFDRSIARRFSVSQARLLAVELWQAAEQLELAEGRAGSAGRAVPRRGPRRASPPGGV